METEMYGTLIWIFMIIISLIPVFFIIIVITLIIKHRKKIKEDEKIIIEKIIKNHYKFDPNELKKQIINNIIEISNCFVNSDFDKLMTLESKTLYEIDCSIIKSNISNDYGVYNSIEDISSLSIVDYQIDEKYEKIFCKANCRYRNITYIPSKKIINSSTAKGFSFKLIEIIKSRDIEDDNNKTSICPMCGAKLEINNIGKCIYCNSYIVNDLTPWVINRIDDAYNLQGIEK